MLEVKLKETDTIEKALRIFKRKFVKTQVVKQLRRRQQFIKPSVVKRQQMIKAKYVQNKMTSED